MRAPGSARTVRARVDHVGITVGDLPRSIAFYARHFGLRERARGTLDGAEVAAAVGVPGARLTWVLLDGAGTTVELLAYAAPGDGAPYRLRSHDVGAAHVCFLVDDVDAACAALRADGVRVLAAPVAPAGTGTAFAYALDPDGVTVELLERGRPLEDPGHVARLASSKKAR